MSAEPPACFAIRPVSTVRLRPCNSTSIRCCMFISAAAHCRSHWSGGRERRRGKRADDGSLPDAETLDELSVAGDVSTTQVVEQPAALADQLEQATTGMVILWMRLEVLGQI